MISKPTLRRLSLAISLATVILLGSCTTIRPKGSDFSDVKAGMTQAEVIRLHGKPLLDNFTMRNGKQYTTYTYVKSLYTSGDWREIKIELFFLDGKLTDKIENIVPPKPQRS